MRLENPAADRIELHGKRLLIFVVAYNAETTIEKVLSRIPAGLHSEDVEVLIIDDSSGDDTFQNGLRYQQRTSDFKITVLRTPQNQGYGGNQKLGYRYAIDHNSTSSRCCTATANTRRKNFPICFSHCCATKRMRSSARA